MTKLDLPELLPCAHCNGDPQTDFIENVSYIIECGDCGAQTGYQDNPEDAVEAWNRRAGTTFAAGVAYGVRMSLKAIDPDDIEKEKNPVSLEYGVSYNMGIRSAVEAIQKIDIDAVSKIRIKG